MSASSNLDFVRSIYADWARGDFSSAEWADPKIEFVVHGGTAAGSWTGLAGMAAGFRNFLDTWEELRSDAEAIRELDHERVLVLFRYSGRGRMSGLELTQFGAQGATLFNIRGGKVTRLDVYADRENAFADLGLAPEADSP